MKKQDSNKGFLQKTNSKYKDTEKLKGCTIQTLIKESWAGYFNVKVDFRTGNTTRDKDVHFIITKELHLITK